MFVDFQVAGGFAGKGVVPVRFLRLAMKRHRGGPILGARADADNGVARLVGDLHEAFRNVEIAGEGSETHHSASSHSSTPGAGGMASA